MGNDHQPRGDTEQLFAEMREAFGRDVTSCYESLLDEARRIVDGQANPKALPTERALERWVATLDPEARQMVFSLCQRMVIGTLFCLMNVLDGTHALFLPRGGRYKLIAELEIPAVGGVQVRQVELNPPSQTWDLHESLYDWVTRFSRFGPPPL